MKRRSLSSHPALALTTCICLSASQCTSDTDVGWLSRHVTLRLGINSNSLDLVLRNRHQPALSCFSTLEFPLCVAYFLSAPPDPPLCLPVCLHHLSPWEPECERSFCSQGWWLPGWAWPIGRERWRQAGGLRDGAERRCSLSWVLPCWAHLS